MGDDCTNFLRFKLQKYFMWDEWKVKQSLNALSTPCQERRRPHSSHSFRLLHNNVVAKV